MRFVICEWHFTDFKSSWDAYHALYSRLWSVSVFVQAPHFYLIFVWLTKRQTFYQTSNISAIRSLTWRFSALRLSRFPWNSEKIICIGKCFFFKNFNEHIDKSKTSNELVLHFWVRIGAQGGTYSRYRTNWILRIVYRCEHQRRCSPKRNTSSLPKNCTRVTAELEQKEGA